MLFDKSHLTMLSNDEICVGQTILGVPRGYLRTSRHQYVCKYLRWTIHSGEDFLCSLFRHEFVIHSRILTDISSGRNLNSCWSHLAIQAPIILLFLIFDIVMKWIRTAHNPFCESKLRTDSSKARFMCAHRLPLRPSIRRSDVCFACSMLLRLHSL